MLEVPLDDGLEQPEVVVVRTRIPSDAAQKAVRRGSTSVLDVAQVRGGAADATREVPERERGPAAESVNLSPECSPWHGSPPSQETR